MTKSLIGELLIGCKYVISGSNGASKVEKSPTFSESITGRGMLLRLHSSGLLKSLFTYRLFVALLVWSRRGVSAASSVNNGDQTCCPESRDEDNTQSPKTGLLGASKVEKSPTGRTSMI
ncbi:unnamed protein product [Cuscuta epithymum]|uniref:Uncharacterized protein n=1 Tax=Cuscuta epithymum TaxID=186058 RepID=A0AAV0G6T6_9ASTE|nr:unnamed protein product [Cuscuta epithymum]